MITTLKLLPVQNMKNQYNNIIFLLEEKDGVLELLIFKTFQEFGYRRYEDIEDQG